MTCSLSWARRDPETGKRQQVEFKLVRGKAHWRLHRKRFEPREPFQPEESDWEELIGQMERNLRRGKVLPADLQIIRRLRQRESGINPGNG